MKTQHYWQDHEGHRDDLNLCHNNHHHHHYYSLSPVQLDLTEPWFPQRKSDNLPLGLTADDSQETWGATETVVRFVTLDTRLDTI